MATQNSEPLAVVPDPRTVRMDLGKRLRELRLLRRLLRLCEEVERERQPHGNLAREGSNRE
ncbi:MAG: hypothetical protein WCI02_15935 [Planctomycetota bacterium]